MTAWKLRIPLVPADSAFFTKDSNVADFLPLLLITSISMGMLTPDTTSVSGRSAAKRAPAL